MQDYTRELLMTILTRERMLVLTDRMDNFYLYYDKYRMLIPVDQEEYITNRKIYESGDIVINGRRLQLELIRVHHAKEVIQKLSQMEELESWEIEKNRWLVNNSLGYVVSAQRNNLVYNPKARRLEATEGRGRRIIRVCYLPFCRMLDGNELNMTVLNELGLEVAMALKVLSSYYEDDVNVVRNHYDRKDGVKDVSSEYAEDIGDKESITLFDLLNCDKKRCGLASYEKEILYDIRAGHWDIYEDMYQVVNGNEKMVGKDPREDIKKNGVIGIDFGTKSTVVVKQEGKNEIRPIRIGSLDLSANVAEGDYENPTIISCMSVNNFLQKYEKKQGRPNTSCEDIFVSYNANEDYKNCPTENFYAYYSNIKQWANNEKKDVIIQDIKDKSKYKLDTENSRESNTINPIEIYAYYIGMYINNMRNGIYLKYIMSFPVKYSKDTKELIRKSFERGIKKSLPKTVIEDAECMSKFSVEYGISEPAAYAVTALEQSGFKPQDEKEKYLYGIFDFGGGTTDFDFGVWRGASDAEYDKYNCDYVLECFGADSDVRLGGENILEMLAYQVFKNNKNMAASKKIACALPVDQIAFIGGESLISNSQSAHRNLTLLKEALRPLWEQHENWESRFGRDKHLKKVNVQEEENYVEYIELQMYDFSGKAVPNCRFDIDTEELIRLIKERIQKGVDSFFSCIEKSILGNKAALCASEKVYIFLAGNSCKSVFVKEAFEKTIEKYNKEYGIIGDKEIDRFELIEPLKSYEMDSEYIPNAKTSVAYGLVKSRLGGKIFIKKNYETDSTEETRFKYYLGTDRRGKFECKLAPIMKIDTGESRVAYDIWHKLQGAGTGIARIYYTDNPSAGSETKISIDNIPFHEISFEPEENQYVYVRAVKPSVIEYVVAETEEKITEALGQLDFDMN